VGIGTSTAQSGAGASSAANAPDVSGTIRAHKPGLERLERNLHDRSPLARVDAHVQTSPFPVKMREARAHAGEVAFGFAGRSCLFATMTTRSGCCDSSSRS